MLGSLIRRLIALAAAVFYRVERRGPNVPDGAVIVAANHPNSLMDPLVLFRTAGRYMRPLAKAPLFELTIIGRLIRAVGGIPVYRREDDPEQAARNEDTFRAATAALLAGDAIQIYPEGKSHSEVALSPLRTGAARIALAAEAAGGWEAGVRIMPVGLTYTDKPFFRGRAIALYGDPFPVAPYRAAWEADPYDAARALTHELGRRLMDLTLNLTEAEDATLIDAAERLYVREKGFHGWREAAKLAERLPRLQAFARGLAWLRANDPDRHERLARAVARYHRKTRILGVGEGDVPTRYPIGATMRWAWRRAAPVLLLTPLAALAAVFWYVPYRLVRVVVGRMRWLPSDVIATYKVAASLIAMPLFFALWVTLAWKLAGSTVALVTALALPPLGFLAVRWFDAARMVRDDLRLFGRVARRPERIRRLAEERRALVAELDEVRAIIEHEVGAPG